MLPYQKPKHTSRGWSMTEISNNNMSSDITILNYHHYPKVHNVQTSPNHHGISFVTVYSQQANRDSRTSWQRTVQVITFGTRIGKHFHD